MIAYEELCESLERFKRRQNNQAELDRLNAAPASAPAKGRSSDTFSLRPRPGEDGFATEPPEDTHEIDVEDVVVDEK